jgi:hypothetical protein
MCLVVVVSIAATAYLAVYFNRRAKADLRAALDPLAALIEGETDLEEAEVAGIFRKQHVKARMANASEGPGRVWQAELLDAAGGAAWMYTSSLPRSEDANPRIEFESPVAGMQEQIPALAPDAVTGIANPRHERFRLEYNPESGFLRFVVPMQNRRDIPDAAKLERQLTYLLRLGDENRLAQERLATAQTTPGAE